MASRYILSESKHYQVSHEFEVVYLARNAAMFTSPKPEIVIGDFYGDPAAAIIDVKERFVAIAGCGLIIYNLVEPFEQYRYNVKTNQWVEMFREEPNLWWIKSLVQRNENTFHFVACSSPDEDRTYQVTLSDLEVRRMQ